MPTLKFDVVSDGSQARRDLGSTRREVDKFGKSTTAVGAQSDRSRGRVSKFGGVVGRLGFAAAATGATAAGYALVKFGGDSIRAASDTEQAFGAVDAVFGRNSAKVKAWANSAVNDVGLARSEFASMASVLGAALKNAGIDNYAAKTRSLIRTGADLAAQFGGSTSEAVEALSSLLRGEADPIERYGVSIKQSDVNARLAAQGLGNLTGNARKAAEMQARLALVTRQTKDAHGAFRREASTLAGQTQRLKANYENLKDTVGRKVTPALSRALGAVNRLFSGQGRLNKSSGNLARTNNGFLKPSLNSISKSADRAKRSFERSGGSMNGLSRAARAYNKVIITAARVTGITTSHAFNVMARAGGVAAAGISRISNALAAVVGWADRAINRLAILRGKQAGAAAFNAASGLTRSVPGAGGLARARGMGTTGSYRSQIHLTSSPRVTIDVDSPALARMFRVIVKDELRQLNRAGTAVI